MKLFLFLPVLKWTERTATKPIEKKQKAFSRPICVYKSKLSN